MMSVDDWLQVHWRIVALAVDGRATPNSRRLGFARQLAAPNASLDDAADWGPAAQTGIGWEAA